MQPKPIRQKGFLWRMIAGWTCILLGVVGLVLPVIPGIPLLLAGLMMLSTQYQWARTAMLWIKRRFRKFRPASSSAK